MYSQQYLGGKEAYKLDELKSVVAENLKALRTTAGLTQGELAERLNYSDKAVSKWERGESLPDVQVLKQLADMYGVGVDYLLSSDHKPQIHSEDAAKIIRKNRLIITLLAVSVVWLVATIAFVLLRLSLETLSNIWLAYIVAIPVSCIVLLVFNSIWVRHTLNFVIISVLMWSTILSFCLILSFDNIWLTFVIGIPAQIIIALWSRLKSTKLGTIMQRASKNKG